MFPGQLTFDCFSFVIGCLSAGGSSLYIRWRYSSTHRNLPAALSPDSTINISNSQLIVRLAAYPRKNAGCVDPSSLHVRGRTGGISRVPRVIFVHIESKSATH